MPFNKWTTILTNQVSWNRHWIDFCNMSSAYQIPETASQPKYSRPWLAGAGFSGWKMQHDFLTNKKGRNKHMNCLRTWRKKTPFYEFDEMRFWLAQPTCLSSAKATVWRIIRAECTRRLGYIKWLDPVYRNNNGLLDQWRTKGRNIETPYSLEHTIVRTMYLGCQLSSSSLQRFAAGSDPCPGS